MPRVDEDARRCAGAGSRTRRSAGPPGRRATAASTSPSASVRHAAPSGLLVEVGRRRSPAASSCQRSRLAAAAPGRAARPGRSTGASRRPRTGRRPTAHRANAAPRMCRPGVSGKRTHQVSRTRPAGVVRIRLPSAGSPPAATTMPERGPARRVLLPPAEPARRLLHDHHVRRERPDHRGQRVAGRPAGCACCTTSPAASCTRASYPTRDRRHAGGPGRPRRRRRPCCPSRPARPRPPAAGRAGPAPSKYERAGRAEQQVAGLDHAAADHQHLRVEDLHHVGQPVPSQWPICANASTATGSPACAAAVTIGPVIASDRRRRPAPAARRRGPAPAGRRRGRSGPARCRWRTARCSRAGRSRRVPVRAPRRMWPELGGDAVRAAHQLAAEHDAAADAGADR